MLTNISNTQHILRCENTADRSKFNVKYMRCRIWQSVPWAQCRHDMFFGHKSLNWMLLWASLILWMIADLLRPLTCFKREHCVFNLSIPTCTFSYESIFYEVWCMCDRASYMKMTRGTNLMQQVGISRTMKVGKKVRLPHPLPPVKCGAGKSFFPYSLDSNPGQLR